MKKKNLALILGLVFLILILTLLQAYLESKKGIPLFPGNLLIFFVINLNFFLILVFLFLIGRTIVKLYIARKRGIVGAGFRMRLVLSFMFLTVVPAFLLFIIAVGFITRSIESWFSERREAALRSAVAIARDYTSEVAERAEKTANLVLSTLRKEKLDPRKKEHYWKVLWVLKKYKSQMGAKFIEIYNKNGELLVSTTKRRSIHEKVKVEERVRKVFLRGRPVGFKQERYYCFFFPDKSSDVVVFVAFRFKKSISEALELVGASYREYSRLKMLKGAIKRGYVITFLMISSLILFASVWFGLQLAKGITGPIEALAQATHRVASGDLDVKVEEKGKDEIALLIRSFNQMTREIARNREELENRRRFMEAVLESVATGVISINKDGVVTTVNEAAKRMLGLEGNIAGKKYWEVFPKEEFASFYRIIREMIREAKGQEKREIAVAVEGEIKHFLVGVSPLIREDGSFEGIVIVFEDITDLVKAKRAEAWEEVARRMAHEIKNPLTPIKLSAQRLKRKFLEKVDDREAFSKSVDTIVKSVDEMKKMVDEFYRFARLPETVLAPGSVRKVVEEVVELYRSSFKDVEFKIDFSEDFPETLMVDEEQMKRVFINLIDNAVEAMDGKGTVAIRGFVNEPERKVVIEVADTGRGIPPEDKEKLFLPYFSRKKGGTGLGLAIVDRIIADHGGYVKVKDNRPKGAVFVIELPLKKVA